METFISIIGTTSIDRGSDAKGEGCWGWKEDLEAHKEWSIANNRVYGFIHIPVDNWIKLNCL